MRRPTLLVALLLGLAAPAAAQVPQTRYPSDMALRATVADWGPADHQALAALHDAAAGHDTRAATIVRRGCRLLRQQGERPDPALLWLVLTVAVNAPEFDAARGAIRLAWPEIPFARADRGTARAESVVRRIDAVLGRYPYLDPTSL